MNSSEAGRRTWACTSARTFATNTLCARAGCGPVGGRKALPPGGRRDKGVAAKLSCKTPPLKKRFIRVAWREPRQSSIERLSPDTLGSPL